MDSRLMVWINSVILLFLSCVSLHSFAFDNYSVQPSWVQSVEIPTQYAIPTNEITDGIYYLLVDKQEYIQNGQFHSFRRYVAKIVNQQGIDEFSQLNINYDPTYESLAFHDLKIHRDGVIDSRINAATFKVLDVESELESQIYNNQKNLNVLLNDLRVGDVVEYSFTRSGQNPVYEGKYSYSSSINWSVPVARLFVKVNWFEQRPLYYKVVGEQATDPVNVIANQAGKQIFEIDIADIGAILAEDKRPSWYTPWSKVQFSDSNNWQQIGQWAHDLYQGKFVLTDEVTDIVNEIKLQPTIKLRVAAALQFVQNQIRYVGIEFGENSHLPSFPSETLVRRYGDCKDKTVLLVTLLNAIGVEARPALVNTDKHHKILDNLPAVGVFNHVITQVQIDNKIYWLDPTRTYQFGSIDEIYQPQYSHALVVKENTESLTEMIIQDDYSGSESVEVFTLGETFTDPVILEVDTIYSGWKGAQQRRKLDADGIVNVGKTYLDYYQGVFGQVQTLADLNIIDNRDNNKFRLQEKYQLDEFWKTKKNYINGYFDTSSVSSYIEKPDEVTRTQPYKLTYPINVKHVHLINLPNDDWDFDEEKFVENNPFFDYSFEVEWHKASRQLKLTYQYKANASYVPAAQYADYLAALDKVSGFDSYRIYKSTKKAKTLELGVSDQTMYWSIIFTVAAAYLLLIGYWYHNRKNIQTHGVFYGVSLQKLLVMNVLTLGIYSAYWFYKNFKYVQQENDRAIKPFWRAIFFIFFIYSLWAEVQKRSDKPQPKNKLIVLSVVMGGLVAVLSASSNYIPEIIWPLTDLAVALVLWPLVKQVNQLNQKSDVLQHSKMSAYHVILAGAFALSMLFSITSFLNLTPQPQVVDGRSLWRHDVNMMVEKGVIKPKEPINQFYSDALVWFSADGNGFTEQRVFSYWTLDKVFDFEVAEYQDIKNITTQWGGDDENTVITITRTDDSDFFIYVSSVDGKDKEFEASLRALWIDKTHELSM